MESMGTRRGAVPQYTSRFWRAAAESFVLLFDVAVDPRANETPPSNGGNDTRPRSHALNQRDTMTRKPSLNANAFLKCKWTVLTSRHIAGEYHIAAFVVSLDSPCLLAAPLLVDDGTLGWHWNTNNGTILLTKYIREIGCTGGKRRSIYSIYKPFSAARAKKLAIFLIVIKFCVDDSK